MPFVLIRLKYAEKFNDWWKIFMVFLLINLKLKGNTTKEGQTIGRQTSKCTKRRKKKGQKLTKLVTSQLEKNSSLQYGIE
ncbi:MAG: hypothetical protein LKF31_11165 [Muribaculaceae bacterium]|jgi:hypothetical protein|nr:hypothetical protein [Muribaculaceae bacterium]